MDLWGNFITLEVAKLSFMGVISFFVRDDKNYLYLPSSLALFYNETNIILDIYIKIIFVAIKLQIQTLTGIAGFVGK